MLEKICKRLFIVITLSIKGKQGERGLQSISFLNPLLLISLCMLSTFSWRY